MEERNRVTKQSLEDDNVLSSAKSRRFWASESLRVDVYHRQLDSRMAGDESWRNPSSIPP
jgi:hypothetical protein